MIYRKGHTYCSRNSLANLAREILNVKYPSARSVYARRADIMVIANSNNLYNTLSQSINVRERV